VDVRGAVAAPTKVLYRPGASFNYYIRQAGGYLEQADEDRVRVQFANGEVATRGRSFLFLGGGIARPDPGSVITVPESDPRDGIQFREVIGVMTSTATAIAALLVAFSRF
jgi:protein involved in polysaccharide export with SLBB domain